MTLTIRIERTRDGWWTASLGDDYCGPEAQNPIAAVRALIQLVEEFHWNELAGKAKE